MGLELQLEDIILLNPVRLHRAADRVAEQWEAGQGIIILQEPKSPALSARHPCHAARVPQVRAVHSCSGDNRRTLLQGHQQFKMKPSPKLLPFFFFYSYLLLLLCPTLPPGLPPPSLHPFYGTRGTDLTKKVK